MSERDPSPSGNSEQEPKESKSLRGDTNNSSEIHGPFMGKTEFVYGSANEALVESAARDEALKELRDYGVQVPPYQISQPIFSDDNHYVTVEVRYSADGLQDAKPARDTLENMRQAGEADPATVNEVNKTIQGMANYVGDVNATGGNVDPELLKLDSFVVAKGENGPQVVLTNLAPGGTTYVVPTPEVRKEGAEIPLANTLAGLARDAVDVQNIAPGQQISALDAIMNIYEEMADGTYNNVSTSQLQRLREQAARAIERGDVHFFNAIRGVYGEDVPANWKSDYLRERDDPSHTRPTDYYRRWETTRGAAQFSAYRYAGDIGSADNIAYYTLTGENDNLIITPDERVLLHAAAGQLDHWRAELRAEREQDGREGRESREKDTPGENPSRDPGDEEGGSALPAKGPEGPTPDPVLPQAPGVLPAEQQEQVPEKEKGTREQGDQTGPSGDAQEREPGGGDTTATPEQNQDTTPQSGLTEDEVRLQRLDQARIAHELAVELAIAAERGEGIPPELADRVEKFFGLGKDGVDQGQTPEIERSTPGEPEQLARLREAEKAVQDALAKAEAERDRERDFKPLDFIRNIEHNAHDPIPKPERNPTIEPPTPGEELARLARADALNPPAAASREREKGFFSGLFGKKEKKKGPEIEYGPGEMKPLPQPHLMNPAERAAHEHQLAMARILQDKGVNPREADTIAQGLSVGGMAARDFAEAVDRRTAEIAVELAAARAAREGQGPKGKDDRELADRAAREARAEVLGAIAEGAKKAERAEREQAQVRENAAREAYDQANPSQAQSVQDIARLVELSHETPTERDKRLDGRALQEIRARGLDERDPKVMEQAREFVEREERARAAQAGRGRAKGGLSQEQSRGIDPPEVGR